MAQEKQKQILLNLNPALNSMVSDEKVFRKAAPMLFGDEFAKLVRERVDQLKTIPQFSKPEQKKINRFWIPPPKFLHERWPWGWKQKQLRWTPAVLEDLQLQIKPKQPRTETVKYFSLVNCTRMPTELHIRRVTPYFVQNKHAEHSLVLGI